MAELNAYDRKRAKKKALLLKKKPPKNWTPQAKATIALYLAALDYPDQKPGYRQRLEKAALAFAYLHPLKDLADAYMSSQFETLSKAIWPKG